MSKDMTAVEVLGIAIKSEEDAQAFYSRMASRMLNSFVKSRFEMLAREEKGHRAMLVSLYTKLTGDKNPPKMPEGVKTAEGGELLPESANIESLFNVAMERERSASAFYRDAAARTKDMSGKRMLEYLSDIERGHEQMLRAELDAYLRDENWYANNPDVQLVGP